MMLKISKDLSLPLEAVTETFALLAKRGAGKSNAAVVMAELMYDAGLPWVAIDPKGDWWGIRSSRDGSGPGLPVLVLGGQHGDVDLEPAGGKLVADLVVDERLTAVVDVSLMSKADMRRFLADFAERLYQRNTEPLHVFAEEAHEYIPQRVTAGDARMVGAWEKLVKWGRTHGLGVTLITQRSASLNKDVLTQVETLIALRTTGPQDQAQIRAWVDEHDTGAAMMAQLRKLPNGSAFVLSPQWLELEEPLRITFNQRRTFDSGATPKAGQKRLTPRTLADVDLAAIKEAMAETIEKAKADDPKALKARIADLERELDAERTKPAPAPERVEVPVLDPEVAGQLEALLAPLTDQLNYLGGALSVLKVPKRPIPVEGKDVTYFRGAGAPDPTYPSAPAADTGEPASHPTHNRGGNRRPSGEPSSRAGAEATTGLSKAQRKVLTVLAQQGTRSTTQVAILTGYSHKSGGYRNALSSLRSAGWIDGRGAITITDDGLDALGPWEPLPTGRDLLEWWKAQHLSKAEKAIVDVLVDHNGGPVDVATIAELTEYSASSGGFRNACSRLRSLEIASGRGDLTLNEELL